MPWAPFGFDHCSRPGVRNVRYRERGKGKKKHTFSRRARFVELPRILHTRNMGGETLRRPQEKTQDKSTGKKASKTWDTRWNYSTCSILDTEERLSKTKSRINRCSEWTNPRRQGSLSIQTRSSEETPTSNQGCHNHAYIGETHASLLRGSSEPKHIGVVPSFITQFSSPTQHTSPLVRNDGKQMSLPLSCELPLSVQDSRVQAKS